MADNIAVTAGSGTTIATDDVGGVHHQKVKIEFGAADAATLVSATDPLPVGHGKTLKIKTGSASATFTVVAAVTSKKIKVYSLSLLSASTVAVTVTFKDGAGGTAIGTYILQAISGTNFGITENVAVPTTLFETSAGTLLEMAFSAAQAVTYNLRYFDDDAS
jgi:Na+/serine symporter